MLGIELQVLPAGFEFPIEYLVGLGLGTLIVGVLLFVLRPEVDSWDVLALGVWMAIGGTLHALHVLGAFPDIAAPLFGAPAVYLTTFIVAGGLWLIATVGASAELFSSTARILGAGGIVAWVGTFIYFVLFVLGSGQHAFAPLWSTLGVFISVFAAGAAFIGLALVHTEAVAATGKVGAFVVFAHTLDGVTTAIGVDHLGGGERTPLPRMIIDFSRGLPTPDVMGDGWLFVVTKMLLAVIIVAVFADYLKDEPARGRIAMALMAAVGFGPGVHNLLLFMVSAA
jgi:uncharacterized membrane protein